MAGCTTFGPVRPDAPGATPQSVINSLEPRALVRLTLRDHTHVTVTVAVVGAEVIVTDSGRIIPRADVIAVEQPQFSGGQTGSLFGVFAVAIIGVVWTLHCMWGCG